MASTLPVTDADTLALRQGTGHPPVGSVLEHLKNLMQKGGIIECWQSEGKPVAILHAQVRSGIPLLA